MADDIVTRLRQDWAESGDDIQSVAERAAEEIERLRTQVAHAHSILASEGALWLVVGSNHEDGWRQALTPSIQSYWDKYGSAFKEARRGDR